MVVAEDETILRVLAVTVLTEAGLMIEAGHAEEALAILQSRLGAINLLFTDIHMPGRLNGLELAHHVRSAWPQIALLITSGEGLPPTAKLPAGSIFLAKPYDFDHVVAHAQTLTASYPKSLNRETAPATCPASACGSRGVQDHVKFLARMLRHIRFHEVEELDPAGGADIAGQ